MMVGLKELLLGAASALVLVGVLACSLLCIPWHLLPDSGALPAVLGLAAALGAAAAGRARGGVRVAAWLAAVALAALSLAAVGSTLGFRVVPNSPYASATLADVPCDSPLILNVTAVPFHVNVQPWGGEGVSVVIEAPSNLVEEVERSVTISHAVDPSDGILHLRIQSEYRRPIAIGWLALSPPELTLRVMVPWAGGCRVLRAYIYTVSGDVAVRVDVDLLSVQSVHGSLNLSGDFGVLEAETVSGGVFLSGGVLRGGTVRSTSGDVRGEVLAAAGALGPAGAGGTLYLSTTSGDIEVEISREEDVHLEIYASTTSGRATLMEDGGGSGGGLDVAVISEGEVRGSVGPPGGREFRLVAETTSGDVTIRYAGVWRAG
ncbi:MAG: DUF4097 family beta strand repeat-containing protein [Candidatus Korarchaeota archaeon]|nr:DUF4097 family beta strand repeat-containing protein [Candidatus Korarchaeota archaeon]